MIEIRRIERSDRLYEQEVALRVAVLLAPLGEDMSIFARDYPGVEERFEHYVAVMRYPGGERVVGCATLLPDYPSPGSGKLMQMAVDPQRQGEGIGRRLVVAIESRALGELGYARLFCHAQLSAVGFYRRLGWVTEGEVFDEAGVPHQRMAMNAPQTDVEQDVID